jgi:hypothetical protein
MHVCLLAQQNSTEQMACNPYTLPCRKFYQEIHTPGSDAPFKVRGPSYLADGRKVAAGQPLFELLGMEVVDIGGPGPCPHISRFLPSVRCVETWTHVVDDNACVSHC